NIRPEYNNLKEWCEDSRNAYIGRGRIVFIDGSRYPPNDSLFANPHRGDGSIAKYESHLLRLLRDPYYRMEFVKLKDKNLGCWCKPKPCHGDVILKYLKLLDE